jgi:hypothetical protein
MMKYLRYNPGDLKIVLIFLVLLPTFAAIDLGAMQTANAESFAPYKYFDPKVAALNLATSKRGSKALLSYPYHFRVFRMEGTISVMSSPRSPGVPIYRVLEVIYPNLAGKSMDSPEFIAAEKQLAEIQDEARRIVIDQPGVSGTKWELDEEWLEKHGIK